MGCQLPFFISPRNPMVAKRTETETNAAGDESLSLGCPVIETRRLLLRPPHDDDIDDMVQLANNVSVASMLGTMPHPYFPDDAKEFLARVKRRTKGDSVYAITNKQDGEFMGCCGLHHDAQRFELPYMGYWLGEPYWNRGFATEAARALVDLFFKVTDREELMISCRRENAPSRAVIAKCGGQFWKAGEARHKVRGELQQLEHFRVTRSSWMAAAFGK
jgi:RimJ/RimL family protein N-acetyltransferase